MTTLSPNLTDFTTFVSQISDQSHCDQLITVLNWVTTEFPELTPRLAWNQPMFTAHGTFIVGFSVAKHHLNVALEKAPLNHFAAQITAQGDRVTKMLWQINFDQPVNYPLLHQAIQYNLTTKAAVTTFWRH
ncbi:iron chaperone [Lactiplantibacillus plajomi]|uniref:Iron chaperone n=1 Tax=Lactiplantibacillus plajomi TaxID=1457217 RepID=A0ABV6K3Q0_9LACO|nr:DUF1801 domain-containing protein [Lactiplantibacillus plajomi]